MTLLDNAKSLRRTMTDAEQKLWYRLRAHRFMGLKFKRQKPMGQYVVDFVCVERKLIIELDGGQHADNREYDQERDAWLRSQGFTVLRLWNNQLMENMEGVLEQIRLTLSPSPSPVKIPSPQSSDGTTSHSANPSKNDGQAAGYPASGRGDKREKQSSIFVRGEHT